MWVWCSAQSPVLICALCVCARAQDFGGGELPELPQINTADFLPAVRAQIERAERNARTHSRDANAAGLTSFSLAPLSISLIIGFLVSVGAFLYLVAIIAMKFLNMNLPGWSAIMVTMLFLGGTQLFTIGILGIYIGRIYNENKKRPNYIIESTSGFEGETSDEVRLSAYR
jgi:hypothetical protein